MASPAADRRRKRALTLPMIALVDASAHAATLRRLEVGELASASRFVVRGHVVALLTMPDLETEATVEVDECLAGHCPRVITVRRFGGERDGRGLVVDGEAELAVGDHVVLFVRADRNGVVRVTGGVQGVWRIDPVHPQAATRDLRGHRVLEDGAWREGERETLSIAVLRSLARQR